MTNGDDSTPSPTLSVSSTERTTETASTSSTFPTGSNWPDIGSLSAAYDFRSDFVTIPTPSMLKAPTTSVLSDNAEEDPTTTSLQAFIADLTGHDEALLVLSGTMGNQLCLRSALREAPHSLLVDHRAHIVTMEAGAVS